MHFKVKDTTTIIYYGCQPWENKFKEDKTIDETGTLENKNKFLDDKNLIECTQEDIDNDKLEKKKKELKNIRQKYLDSKIDKTDKATQEINLIEDCTTLQELDNYNNF